ncbi:MAG: Cna B-type domain-containing protein, partial [Eubacterium sp.]|nr:Cna B-type domain-containing protein [Eubacterium sp.]
MNTYTENDGSRDITVTKEWIDADNQDGLRPTSLAIELLANNQVVDTVNLSEGSVANGANWSYKWEDLPEKENGKAIVYKVREVTVPAGYTVTENPVTVPNSGEVMITNTHEPEKIEVAGQKTWKDNNDQDGKRPTSITVNLLKNGKKEDSKTIGETDDWKYSFTDLPKFEKGVQIAYTVQEDAVAEYVPTYNGFDIVNTHDAEKINITVNKVWDDANNQDGKRPTEIKLELLNGSTVVKTATVTGGKTDGMWSYTFKDLDKYAAGTEIVYTVREANKPTDYTVIYDETDPTATAAKIVDAVATITNSYEPESIKKIKVTKHWDDADNQDGKRPTKVTVRLLANGAEVANEEVSGEAAAETWEYEFTEINGKPIPKYANGEEISYTVTEDAVEDYVTTINGFEITNTHKIGKTSVTVTKSWADSYNGIENYDGKRHVAVKVKLLADDIDTGKTLTLNAENGWSGTFDNLDVYKNGTKIQYT